ncbi:MAG: transposase [Planctomycetaceae bacterium]|nr:transposase [Planctomycetaceae bacterium]
MGRALRILPGGYAYHIFNRANARVPIFTNEQDYLLFENTLFQACIKFDMRLCTYCIMPNHWHLVLWPQKDNEISSFMRWLTLSHTQRWHSTHKTTGSGHLYQGRFKSFPVQEDSHFLTLCRYVERNPLNAAMVEKAEQWRWSAMWHRMNKIKHNNIPLSQWPVEMPNDWQMLVNQVLHEKEIAEIRRSIEKNRPFGEVEWMMKTSSSLGLNSTLKGRGRPLKTKGNL